MSSPRLYGEVVRPVSVVVVAASMMLACSSGAGTKPIGQQNCAELAATLASIQHSLRPDAPFSEQSKAGKDAGELNARVDALGGCPNEPTLQ